MVDYCRSTARALLTVGAFSANETLHSGSRSEVLIAVQSLLKI
jgi:hypothetical protein